MSNIKPCGFSFFTIACLGFFLLSEKVSCQTLATTVLTEKTVLGQQFGGRVGREGVKGSEIGAFYQRNITNTSTISLYGYELTGIYGMLRVLGNEEFNLSPSVRLAVSDRQFIVLIPGLEVKALLGGNFYLHFSAGLRASEAAFSLGLTRKVMQGKRR